jgi:hypothetical protein
VEQAKIAWQAASQGWHRRQLQAWLARHLCQIPMRYHRGIHQRIPCCRLAQPFQRCCQASDPNLLIHPCCLLLRPLLMWAQAWVELQCWGQRVRQQQVLLLLQLTALCSSTLHSSSSLTWVQRTWTSLGGDDRPACMP